MPRPSKYSPELRERAVRMVIDHVGEQPSHWATIRSVAEKLGCAGRLRDEGGVNADWRAVSRLLHESYRELHAAVQP